MNAEFTEWLEGHRKREEDAMAKKFRQTEIPGTEVERIGQIENQADDAKEKEAQIAGLKDEVINHKAKIAELMEANLDKLQKKGNDYYYKHGTYNIRLHAKKTVSIKIKDAVQKVKE